MKTMSNTGKNQKVIRKVLEESVELIESKCFSL